MFQTVKSMVLPPRVAIGDAPPYVVGRKIGSGKFGHVAIGVRDGGEGADDGYPSRIALKFGGVEMVAEASAYFDAAKEGVSGLPWVYFYGKVDDGLRVLGMDLMGPSLLALLRGAKKSKLEPARVARLAIGALNALEALHAAGYIHGDVKPENMVQDRDRVCLVDLGLARRWTKEAYDQRPGCFNGTARYASLHAHLGRTPSRRDDLASLFYSLVYLLRGRLPWGDDDDWNAVGRMKAKATFRLPTALRRFHDAVMSLRFDADPPYAELRAMFGPPPRVLRKRRRAEEWMVVSEAGPGSQQMHPLVSLDALPQLFAAGKVTAFASAVAVEVDAHPRQAWTHGVGFSESWIQAREAQGYHITSVAMVDAELLVVMDQGTPLGRQTTLLADGEFPFAWIRRQWEDGFRVTALAAGPSSWAVVMTCATDIVTQAVELDFVYPSEGIHRRWDAGYRVTCGAATSDQVAFVLSLRSHEAQTVDRMPAFPEAMPGRRVIALLKAA